MRAWGRNEEIFVPDSEVVTIQVYVQQEDAAALKQIVFETCGQGVPIVTMEAGAVAETIQLCFDVPASMAETLTLRLILRLPGNRQAAHHAY